MKTEKSLRLNKFISDSGFCSRREADRHIELGNVFVNRRRAAVGDMVKPTDRILVNGHNIEPQTADDLILIALNKPVGITSTTETGTVNNIIEFVNHSHRIFPIGRLDKDSQGLIFLTNNGDLVNKILRAGNRHEKEYVVTVNKPVTPEFIDGMAQGVPLAGTRTKKCWVQKETPFIFRITLIQGLNRQIRRMCSHFGYEVVKLERVRIMNIVLKGIPLGDWRNFTEEEVEVMMKELERSSSTPRKERSFSKNREFRKSGLSESKTRGDAPKPKASGTIKKKTNRGIPESANRPKLKASRFIRPKPEDPQAEKTRKKPSSLSGRPVKSTTNDKRTAPGTRKSTPAQRTNSENKPALVAGRNTKSPRKPSSEKPKTKSSSGSFKKYRQNKPKR